MQNDETPVPGPEWDEVLDRASSSLDSSDPLSQIFWEHREELRVLVDSGGTEVATRTATCGAAVRRGGAATRSLHVSDPHPEDVLALVKGKVPRRPRQAEREAAVREGSGLTLEPEAARAAAHHLIETAMTLGAHIGEPSVRVLLVAFEQAVRIGRPGRPVVADVRRSSRLHLDVTIVTPRGTGVARGDQVLRAGPADPPEVFAGRVLARAEERIGASAPPSGPIAAVFAAGAGGILLHEIVGHALEADTVARGGSLLARRHRRVGDAAVRVMDDPRRGRAAWTVDDEGEPSKPTPLIDDGRVVGSLHDLTSSMAAGVGSTGHGRRSGYQEEVLPRMGCTFLAAGSARPADVIAGVRSGVHIRRMEAAVVRPEMGEASFVVSDSDQIRDGRLAGALRPFVMTLSTLRALEALDGIADDLAFDTCIGACLREGQPMATTVGAPTFRIGLVRVMA